ncbi:SpoIIIAH-like family protein [Alicyclobacillus mengziensis]|uniref:SpoIIIAH-like family protein n=1 Tax=Alicyclobacillus mengziensis TaxID=2931921 RepID=A0A9X7VVL3_9BACL|nr:SpoIIIAH-like family protein [Alicyclobacillus mengziensis]QSO45881.1 SpoIIIAH-like family protein [Alicyclobacillus mengziensis]
MVKRQTVWLSTMMVLSLMLIGYYTMNNESSLTTTSTNGTSVATSTTGVPGSSSTSANQATANQTSGSQNTAAATGTPTTTTDWFVNMQTQLDTEMTKQIDAEEQILANNNASAQELSQAEDKLRQLQNEQGALANAKEMILAKGYQDCVIVPSTNGNQVVVYVKASQLSNTKAVELMNIVSQQMNVSASNVIVKIKA